MIDVFTALLFKRAISVFLWKWGIFAEHFDVQGLFQVSFCWLALFMNKACMCI